MAVRVMTQDIVSGRVKTIPHSEDVHLILGSAGHGNGLVYKDSAGTERERLTCRGYRRMPHFFFYDDFFHDGGYFWSEFYSGTGSGSSPDAGGGLRRLSTGGTNGSYSATYMSAGDFAARDGNVAHQCRVRLAPSGTITNYYLHYVLSDVTGGSQTNQAGFIIDRTQSANWLAYNDAAGSATQTDTGLAVVANTWYSLRVEETSGDIKFYINGTLYATHTTNLPVSSAPRTPYFYLGNQANQTKTVDLDFIKVWAGR